MELIILVLIVVGLSYIPVVGSYLSLFNTMLHESGHAIASLLTGGKVHKVKLFGNTEGVAQTSNNSWVGKVITTLCGYPFSSCFSVLGIWGLMNQLEFFVAITLFLFLVINAVLWVRNFIGWLWIASSILLLGWLYMNYLDWFYTTVYMIVIVVWIQALHSSWVILILSIKDRKNAGDATILASYTFIPTVVWGMLFAFQGTAFFIGGLIVWSGEAWSEVISFSNNLSHLFK